MGWATGHITRLQAGETITIQVFGSSMTGRVANKATVEIAPLAGDPVRGDVVMCKVGGSQYLHLVSAVKGDRFQISNNHGHVNGTVGRDRIYGRMTRVVSG